MAYGVIHQFQPIQILRTERNNIPHTMLTLLRGYYLTSLGVSKSSPLFHFCIPFFDLYIFSNLIIYGASFLLSVFCNNRFIDLLLSVLNSKIFYSRGCRIRNDIIGISRFA